MSKSLSFACAVLCALAALLATPERVCPAQWDELSPAGKRITQALSEATVLEFIDTPLRDVIDTLKDLHGIEIRLDSRALGDVGIPSYTPLTKELRGVSLRSGLRLMLRDLDLTYTVANDVLLITTPEEAEARTCVRVYPVEDLIARRSGSGSKQACESLVKAVSKCVQPASWKEKGGQGTISPIPPAGPKSLVVSQCYGVHERIGDFLEMLRAVARDFPHVRKVAPSEAVSMVFSSPSTARAERRIAEALKEQTVLEFINAPLQDVIDTLKDLHGIEIQIDEKVLEDIGVPTDSPITMNLRGVSLGSALRLMLRDRDLTYVIRNEVLLITTPEEAQSMLATKVYPLDGLAVGQGRASKSGPSYGESIIKTITTVIRPESWDHAGGPGTLVPLRLGEFEVLVVRQSGDVHGEVAGLLSRKEFRQPGRSEPKSAPRRKPRLGLFRGR